MQEVLDMADHRGFLETSIALALVGVMLLSGCGDGDEGEGPADATDTTSASASADPSEADDEGSAAGIDRCPLSAEQVSEVLGQDMTVDEASCSFYPADESAILPNASFNVQLSLACSEDGLSGMDYEQPVGGIGDAAYVQRGRADGTWLLVCAGDSPFELRVDSGSGDDASQAAAEELARRVLAGR
ncbi:MAG: hypothetical protein ABR527_03070 [Gemmatimonadota bacterium]